MRATSPFNSIEKHEQQIIEGFFFSVFSNVYTYYWIRQIWNFMLKVEEKKCGKNNTAFSICTIWRKNYILISTIGNFMLDLQYTYVYMVAAAHYEFIIFDST